MAEKVSPSVRPLSTAQFTAAADQSAPAPLSPAVLLKKACNIEKGSGVPQKDKVAKISREDLRKIAETKAKDLNAGSIEAAMSMIAGTARSMGIVVEEG